MTITIPAIRTVKVQLITEDGADPFILPLLMFPGPHHSRFLVMWLQ